MPELIISHTRGLLPVYNLARFFSDRDMSFETTIYVDPEDVLPRALRKLGLHSLVRQLMRRYYPGIHRKKVHLFPYPDLLYLTTCRVTASTGVRARVSMLRNQWFDKHVAARVRRLRPRVVIAHDSAARHTFEAAREVGATTILSQAIGHHAAAKEVFDEERRRHPDFADTLPTEIADRWVNDAIQEVRLADHVVGGSEYVRQSVIAVGCPPDRAHVAPYAADTNKFVPGEPGSNDPVRILFVGQIGMRKGIPYLLEAFSRLKRPGVELLLVGPMLGSGEGLKRYAGLFKHIPSLPHGEIPALMRSADIFAFPSLHEGSAVVIFEALASGLPVIVTPNSGSVVEDGVEGFVVPIRDIDALAARLSRLVDDPELRRRMGAAARETALAWTWERYCRTFDKLVGDVLKS